MKADPTFADLKPFVNARTFAVFERAAACCSDICAKAREVIDVYLGMHSIDPNSVCFAAVGSVGRCEALEASDLDVVPIFKTKTALEQYKRHDKKLRQALREALKIDVSKGDDLTQPTTLADLTKRSSIGGEGDDTNALTKRLLLVTESVQLAGGLSLRTVRDRILRAYGAEERTSGSHVLSFCNDIARYFRTLCIEYKAKVDAQGKDWCTRNLKLRHSRKIWYFSTMFSIVLLAEKHPQGSDGFLGALLDILEQPPTLRLTSTASSQPIDILRLFEHYALFLHFMSSKTNRDALAAVKHSERYDINTANPFPALKFNSDILHNQIIDIVEGLPLATRHRVFDWFLL
jgi:hypothetical protein